VKEFLVTFLRSGKEIVVRADKRSDVVFQMQVVWVDTDGPFRVKFLREVPASERPRYAFSPAVSRRTNGKCF